MISVEQALEIVQQNLRRGKAVSVPTQESFGCVLAEDIVAPMPLPSFRQSSMDGYAIIHSHSNERQVIGEQQAGLAKQFEIEPSQAIRIFTGAAIPTQADTVVIQEHVKREGNQLTIEKMPAKGANVRQIGEQIKKGESVFPKGFEINEAAIAMLASLGIEQVSVYQKPKISILVTGNELKSLGTQLKPGEIYESNSLMLQTALQKQGITDVQIIGVPDNLDKTENAIDHALGNSDVLLLSGGISVGDYDFVRQSLQANHVQELFYKVKQKPGKPLYFGKKEDKVVFGLPGNPASSLTCFNIYVLPLLRHWLGKQHIHLLRTTTKTAAEINNPFGRALFLKAHYNSQENQVESLNQQASSMIQSFAQSNALIYLPAETTHAPAGEPVQIIHLNRYE